MTTTVQPSNVHAFPTMKPGHHLAPLTIGTPGAAQRIVYVECPDWCVTDHMAESVDFVQDVTHTGADFTALVYSFISDGLPICTLSAALGVDPMSTDPALRDAHIIVSDEGSVDAYLTPEMADQAADDLAQLAAKLRETARTARLHNQHAEVAA